MATPTALATQLAASGLDEAAIAAELIAAGIDARMAENQAAMAHYAHTRQTPDRARYSVVDFPHDPFLRLPLNFIDLRMPDFTGNEVLVLLYILRRTVGFRKDADQISISQFARGIKTRDGRQLDRGTGLSPRTVCRVLNSLEERGILERERITAPDKSHAPTGFRLRWPKVMTE